METVSAGAEPPTPSATASPDGRYDFMEPACPTRQIVSRIGDKWTLLVLYALAGGTHRYTELRAEVKGVSQKMLTQTLRALERDGLVDRHVHATVPPRVDYSLTPLGASLGTAIATIRTWAYDHVEEVEAAREDYDDRDG
jgi:DNA-binding HxlR family transcriptional regulator